MTASFSIRQLFRLKEQLVLLLVLAPSSEDALHSGLDESVERLLELGVGIRALELEEIKVALLSVEVKPIDAVVVSAKRDLRDCAVALESELLLKVQKAKVVVPDAAADLLQARERLINCPICDCHGLVS
jgi:hypothetical protein